MSPTPHTSLRKPNRGVIIALIIGVLTIAGIITGVLLLKNQVDNNPAVSSNIMVTRENPTTFLVRNTINVDAPVVDVWEDPMCPYCQRFEKNNNTILLGRVEEGTLAVRYHVMTVLDSASDTRDYSSRVVRALDAVSNDGVVFMKFHQLVFENAPREGSSLSNNDLVGLLQRAGAGNEQLNRFQSLVNDLDEPVFVQAISDSRVELRKITGKAGVPVVSYQGREVDVTALNWLDNIK